MKTNWNNLITIFGSRRVIWNNPIDSIEPKPLPSMHFNVPIPLKMHAELWERKSWNDKCEIRPCSSAGAAQTITPSSARPDFTIIEFSHSKMSQRSTTQSDVCGLPYDLPLPSFFILFRSKQLLYFSWMQASNFPFSIPLSKAERPPPCVPGHNYKML